ncbi:MAG TPA: hypothetical protein VF045_03380, partial [Acidimicrobiales bacterium]
MRTRGRPAGLLAALALATAACQVGDDRTAADLTDRATSTAPATQSATRPTTTVAPLPTVPPPATSPTCPATPHRADPDPARPRYRLSVDVRLDENVVRGTTEVRFTPDLDTDRLVFRLWPNGPRTAPAAAKLETGQVTIAGRPVASAMEEPTILVVRAGALFRAGQTVDVAMPWELRVPGPANDRISRNGDAMRLGSFFPILPWEPGVGWATDAPAGGFAEASTAPVADFELTVVLPEGYDVLASG